MITAMLVADEEAQMKFRILPALILICTPFTQLHAQNNDLGDTGTGTFSLEEEAKPAKEAEGDQQLEMQKEEQEEELEEKNLDSFGKDKFNENVDSEMYKTR